jgi:hypothetical protein
MLITGVGRTGSDDCTRRITPEHAPEAMNETLNVDMADQMAKLHRLQPSALRRASQTAFRKAGFRKWPPAVRRPEAAEFRQDRQVIGEQLRRFCSLAPLHRLFARWERIFRNGGR